MFFTNDLVTHDQYDGPCRYLGTHKEDDSLCWIVTPKNTILVTNRGCLSEYEGNGGEFLYQKPSPDNILTALANQKMIIVENKIFKDVLDYDKCMAYIEQNPTLKVEINE